MKKVELHINRMMICEYEDVVYFSISFCTLCVLTLKIYNKHIKSN